MNSSSPLRQLIKSGLAYGFGLALGNTFSVLIFQLAPTEQFLVGSPAAKLVQGILWAFFIMGIGGFLGGGIGGYTLPAIGRGKGRWGYAWRSGITFGIGYGLLVFPVILITSLLSFYDISSTPFYVFSLTYGLIGIVFGLIMGLSLGVWTIGRRFPPITWMSAVGFGLGGTVLGYTVWAYILEVTNGQVADGSWWLLLVGVFGFGGLGGTALGFAYHRLAAQTNGDIVPVRGLSLSGRRRRWAIIGGILFLIALLIRPTIAAVGDLLTPRDAALSAVLDLPTTGTHWLGSSSIAPLEQPTYPVIAAGANGRIALSWIQNNQIYLQQGQWNSTDMQSSWQVAATVGGNNQPSSPELVVDENGRIHLVWLENNVVQYSQCLDGNCTAPVSVKTTDSCEQPLTANNRSPALTTDGSQLLLVWENNGMLPYAVWPMDGTLPETAVNCLPVNNAETPHLANKGMALTYTVNDSIFVTTFDGNWSPPEQIGDGRLPDLFTANDGSLHATWCNLEDGISYWYGGQVESVSTQSCLTRPDLLLDDNRQAHVVWYGAEVEDVNGRLQPRQLIYESIKTGSTWTSPAIVGQSQNNTQPAMAASADGALHLAWDGGQTVNYAAQVQYECDTAQLTNYGRILYDIARKDTYLPADDPVPFCQNQYDRLLITPNPDPAYSNDPMPPNGVYDKIGDMIRGAQYEVLFSTMWYSSASNHDSPGAVIAASVAALYNKVKANPEQYPRGMTVRILLDNPPELATGKPTGQLWSLIGDLRYAGIDKMVDEEIGWRLEVADFEGNLPHSHVKTVVVDGKTAAANGFNMTYDHFPTDHQSGLGKGRFDVGLQIIGPAAQATQRMFDDMWAGADQRYCLNLHPPLGIPWQVTCFDKTAVADHVPEVQKFYLPGGSSTAFSMYRSKVHDQADQQTIAVLTAAQESVDVIHVNFTLDLICNLNILFEVCNFDIAPDYMTGLLAAAQKGATVRVIIKPGPFEGIENQVALNALGQRLEELGIEDRIEVRYFNGSLHPKVTLIDNQLLIVGSQNLHYSAFGSGGGLTEYSIATEDPQAISDFQKVFEYEWAQAIPAQ